MTTLFNTDSSMSEIINWQSVLSTSCNRKETNLEEPSEPSSSWHGIQRSPFTSTCTLHKSRKPAPSFLCFQPGNSLWHGVVDPVQGLVQPQCSRHSFFFTIHTKINLLCHSRASIQQRSDLSVLGDVAHCRTWFLMTTPELLQTASHLNTTHPKWKESAYIKGITDNYRNTLKTNKGQILLLWPHTSQPHTE